MNNKIVRLTLAGLAFIMPTLAGAQEAEMGMDHSHMFMPGMYGPYSMTREASGTSWQPDSTPHEGVHRMLGEWMVMVHGYADGIYDASPRKNSRGWPEDPPLTGQWSSIAEHLCQEGIKLSTSGQHRAAVKGLERLLYLLHHSEYGRYEIVYADEFGLDYYVLVDFKKLLKAFFSSLKKSSMPKEFIRRGLAIARLSSWNDNPEAAAFLENVKIARTGAKRKA